MKGKIFLDNGENFSGEIFTGKTENIAGKIIFDTRVVGYEKVLTSPEYRDKIVVFAYPLIGNYGINREDMETDDIYPSGIVLSEMSPVFSNHRAFTSLQDFLNNTKLPVLTGVDTQYLTSIIREKKSLWAAIVSTDTPEKEASALIKKSKTALSRNFPCCYVQGTGLENENSSQAGISVLNLGIKKREMEKLGDAGIPLNVFSTETNHIEELIRRSKALYVTSGPENKPLLGLAARIVEAFLGRVPVFGSGLGHLVVGKAAGGIISRKYINHYGINHPVLECESGKCLITEQSHGLILKKEGEIESFISHVHLNDKTVEGLFDPKRRILTTAFQPGAETYSRFFSMIKE